MTARGRMALALTGVTLLVAASVVPVSAQGRRGGMQGGMFGRRGGLMLLRNESVQQELKMTQPQIDKIDAKQQEVQQAMQEWRTEQGIQGGQPGQGNQMDPATREKMTAKQQELQQKALADILDTTQLKRFNQIQLQQEGPAALNRKDVADELKLTEEQRTQVRTIQREAMQQMRAAFQGVDFRNMTPEQRQEMTEKMQAQQKATGEKYLAVLNDDQKAQWTKMQGEPFKLVVPERRQPGV